MSIYSSEIISPSTQIFNPQPNDLIKFNINHEAKNNKLSSTNKPTAYISPIEKLNFKDKSVQTDSVSVDIKSIIDIHDFKRSERLVGKLDDIKLNSQTSKIDLVLAETKIKNLEDAIKQQLKNNEDVKKLLIASLGEDLASHYLKLTSDVSSFNLKIDDLILEKTKSMENIDKLSIEANLWKNKFIAGRLLAGELAGWKQHFSVRYQESLDAIHALLQERQSLRQYLIMIANELSTLSVHLNCNPKSMSFDNTLHMAKYDLDIVKTVANKLSSGTSWNNDYTFGDNCLLSCSEFTEGEEMAIEVLKNQINLNTDNSDKTTGSISSENSLCLEKLTANVCKNCRGDPFVI